MSTVTIPDKRRVASFDVDAQNTFTPVCPDELPVPGGTEIVDELNAQAAFAAVRVGSKDAHSPRAIWVADAEHPVLSPIEGENVDRRWPVHAVPGTIGFELIEGLPEVTGYDYFVWKGVELDMHPYGACYHDIPRRMSTGVIEYLRASGVDTVLVGGLATDYCVRATVLELLEAGFSVVLNLGAARGIAEDTVRAATDEMKRAGARIVDRAADLRQEAVA